MGKKVKARGRMRLLSIIGRFLFAWFFIFSGFKSLKEIWTDNKVKKEFTTMMVCLVRFQADTPESVILAFACYFVAVCASWKAIGGFLIMFDKIGGGFPLMLYLLITTLVRCLYYYKVGEPEFVVLLQGFMQEAVADLAPCLEINLQHLMCAFGKYQRRNFRIVYDAIGTLADAVGGNLIRLWVLDMQVQSEVNRI